MLMLREDGEKRETDRFTWRVRRPLLFLVILVSGCEQERIPAERAQRTVLAEEPSTARTANHSVLVDQAHFNIPGLEPFVELLIQQDYEVVFNTKQFSWEGLKEADILVIGAPQPHDLSNSVAISPDGQTLASAGKNRTIQLWDLDTGSLRTTLPETDWVGPLSYAAGGRMLASASAEHSVKLWDTETGEVRAFFKHPAPVRSVSVSPDGGIVASAGDNQRILLWESDSGGLLKTLSGHTSGVLDVTFSPDGVTLASSGRDGITRLWDVASGEVLTTFRDHRGPVHQAVFAPDGLTMASASADGTVKVWSVESGRVAFTLTEETASVAFSPDGSILATGGETTVKLWSVGTGQMLTAIETDSDWVKSLSFSPDGELLAWVDDDEAIRVWSLSTNRIRHILPGRVDALWRVGSAFTDQECRIVIEWISAGGNLLLITDHAPWATPSQCLTAALGVDISNSNGTIDPNHYLQEGNMGWLVFTRRAGLVGDHPVTRGRNFEERIDNVVTFYGQSLMGPSDFTPFLTLSASAVDLVESGDSIPAAGRAQGIAGQFGKGRVVVLGEAMMFMEAGLTRSDYDNRQLAINTVRWLSGELN